MRAHTHFCLFFLLLATYGHAQSPPLRAEIHGRYANNAVILRWAPTDFKSWKWGVQHGYELIRGPLKLNGQPLDMAAALETTVLATGVLPLGSDKFEEFVNENTDRDWPAIAASTLYGEGFRMLSADTATI
jgi:hypothetical protein